MTGNNDRAPQGGEEAGYLDYDNPADIMGDDSLNDSKKQKLLEDWKMDVDSRLYSESEGMSKSEPISAELEAMLAEQERQINKALQTLKNSG